MDLELAGHVALVVGGSGTIGAAVVERLRAEGATVIAASRSGAEGVTLDAGDEDSIAQAIKRILAEHGRLDAVVVAAAAPARTLDADRHADPQQVMRAINEKAMVFLRVANAVLPVMTEAGYGRIVGVSGQNAFISGSVTASVRNAALTIAAKSLADSVAGSGVTINTVSPGLITSTPSPDVEQARGGDSTPQQIADVITFLVSPRAAAVSGESLAVGHRMRGIISL